MITVREGESVIKVYRRHKFILIFELAPLVFFAFIIIAAAFLSAYLLTEKYFVFLPLIFLVAIVFIHQLWIIIFMYLADFYLDVWILTNKRLTFIEQKGMFSRTVIDFELGNIQDISSDVHGILPTLFRYGNIRIHTASENQNFDFKNVGEPDFIKHEIAMAIAEYKKLGSQVITPIDKDLFNISAI